MKKTSSEKAISEFRMILTQLANSKIEIITNFSSVIGEIKYILMEYVVVHESNGNFTMVPLSQIDSLIFLDKEVEL